MKTFEEVIALTEPVDLGGLFDSPIDEVRMGVAANLNSPPYALQELLDDKKPVIATLANRTIAAKDAIIKAEYKSYEAVSTAVTAMVAPDIAFTMTLGDVGAQLGALRNSVEELEVNDNPSATACADIAKQVGAKLKWLEAKRKEFTTPLDDRKKEIMDMARPYVDGLTEIFESAKNKINRYNAVMAAEVERKRKEAAMMAQLEADRQAEERLRRMAEAVDRDDMEVVQALEVAPAPVVKVIAAPPKIQGARTRTDWKWKVVNIKEVPVEFLLVNEKELNSLARLRGERASVPGIEFFPEQSVTIR